MKRDCWPSSIMPLAMLFAVFSGFLLKIYARGVMDYVPVCVGHYALCPCMQSLCFHYAPVCCFSSFLLKIYARGVMDYVPVCVLAIMHYAPVCNLYASIILAILSVKVNSRNHNTWWRWWKSRSLPFLKWSQIAIGKIWYLHAITEETQSVTVQLLNSYTHVLVHCVKSIRAYNVKSSSTLFSDNIQWNF